MSAEKKTKVLMYYSFGDSIGGPLTYLRSIMDSELNTRFEFATCFQNMAPGGLKLSLLLRMMRQIKQENADIVHVHGLQSEGFYGVLAAKMAGCRHIVTTVHGFAFDAQRKYGVKWILYRYLVEPLTLRLSDRVYCVCRHGAQRPIITRNTKGNGRGYIHSAIGPLRITQTREALRDQLQIAPQETVFVISGRISKAKGFGILAQAVKLLNQQQAGAFRLMVLGDGEYETTFRAEMAGEIQTGQVIMVGRTDRVADYLNAADICLLPSYHENLPLALLEAGKMGLACIASNVGGVPEIIRDGETGFLVEEQLPCAYARKMEILLSDVVLRQRMQKAIQQDMDERFSMSQMCKKIEEIYVHDRCGKACSNKR